MSLQLASDNPKYIFGLVLNASPSEIETFFQADTLPTNLTVFPSQKDLHPYYQWADVIVNLSRPDGWIETFGLTIIEGMAYGLPAIVPPVGGILEVIDEGKSGFAVDSRDSIQLNKTLVSMLDNRNTYRSMSSIAKERLTLFREEEMMKKVYYCLKKKNQGNNMNNILNEIGIENYIYLAVILFSIGVFGVLYRRNAIIVFMSIEIMLNAVNLLFVAFSTYHQDAEGQVFVFFSMAVAAAELAVGLAILVSVFRNIGSIDIGKLKNLKG